MVAQLGQGFFLQPAKRLDFRIVQSVRVKMHSQIASQNANVTLARFRISLRRRSRLLVMSVQPSSEAKSAGRGSIGAVRRVAAYEPMPGDGNSQRK
jgi:hypothetical protein